MNSVFKDDEVRLLFEQSTSNHGGCVIMLWGCFNGSGIGRSELMLKSDDYQRILDRNLLPTI